MADLGLFNANDAGERMSFDLIPPGDYEVMLGASEMKATKDIASGNQYLNLEFVIMSGEFQGRKIWDRLNLINKNAQAAEIAQAALGELCRACGKATISNSEELHNISIIATVKVSKPKDGGDDRNVIAKYSPLSSNVQQNTSATQSNPTSQGLPWNKR